MYYGLETSYTRGDFKVFQNRKRSITTNIVTTFVVIELP